jgi:TolB-like protein/DNA-binding winged helix-turn-helix (wHTH) protein
MDVLCAPPPLSVLERTETGVKRSEFDRTAAKARCSAHLSVTAGSGVACWPAPVSPDYAGPNQGVRVSDPLRFGRFELRPDERHLLMDGEPVSLGARAFDLLLALVERRDRMVAKSELLDLVWPGLVVEENNLQVQVSSLRKILGSQAIATVAGLGYRFTLPTVPIDGVPPRQASPRHKLPPQLTSFVGHEGDDGVKSPPGLPERLSIAVLPLVNLSGDPAQDYFSDGLTEDIITELTRWRLLAVRSRSASFRFRGAAVDIEQVARELNVRYVVEGSVRRLGETIRIHVQLIDAHSANHVWAEKFDRQADEIFVIQDTVVQTIVSTLVGRVQVDDTERARRKPPGSLAAYECVLRGNALPWDDPAGAAEATRLFEKAVEIDPGYGIAYALLSNMRIRDWAEQMGKSDAHLDEAYRLAQRSVELAENESTCHSLLAMVHLYRREYDLALQQVRRAVELNPNNQWNLADMAYVVGYMGDGEQALQWSARAKQADPYFCPPWFWRQQARSYLTLQKYEEALGMLERIPGRNWVDAAYMAGCHTRLGNVQRAREFGAECLAMRPDFSIRKLLLIQPFKSNSDADNIAQSLRLAGLPD